MTGLKPLISSSLHSDQHKDYGHRRHYPHSPVPLQDGCVLGFILTVRMKRESQGQVIWVIQYLGESTLRLTGPVAVEHSVPVLWLLVGECNLIDHVSRPWNTIWPGLCRCRLSLLFQNVTQTIMRLNVAPVHNIPTQRSLQGGPFQTVLSSLPPSSSSFGQPLVFVSVLYFLASSYVTKITAQSWVAAAVAQWAVVYFYR